jgi:hypothetical protein
VAVDELNPFPLVGPPEPMTPEVLPEPKPIVPQAPVSMAPKASVAPVSDVPPAPKYDDVLSMLRAERKSQVEGAMFAAEDAVPERRARAIELAKRFHTQPEFVERHYEEFEKAAKPALDYDELVDKFPGLSKWLTTPDNAALGKNELHALSKAEESLRKLMPPKPEPFAFDQAIETGWNQFKSGMWALGAAYGQGDPDAMAERYFEASQRAKRLAETAPQYAQEWKRVVLEQEGKDLEAAFKRLTTTFDSIRRERILEGLKALGQDASMTVAEFFDMVREAAKRPAGTLYFNLEQLPQMAPSLGLSAAGALGGFAVAGPPGAYAGYLGGNFIGQVPVETGAWIAEELKNHGVNTDDLESVKAAFRNPQLMAQLRSEGLAKGITTAAVDTMFAALGGKLVAQAGSLPRKLVRGAIAVAGEAAGEGVSEAAGQLAARGGDITKVDPVEVAAEIIGGLGHSVGQTAIGAAAASVRKALPKDTVDAAEEVVSRVSKANQAIEAAGHLQQVATAIREAKTVAAIPEKVQELVDAVTDGEATEVFFQTDDWDAYWTGKGLSPAKAAEDIMGDGAKAYMEAKTSGAPMAIPMGAYAAKVAPTEHFEGLLPVTRTAIDGMTFQQAREEMRALPAIMEELVREATTAPVSERTPPTGGVVTEEIDRKAKALQKRIAAELKAAGRSADEAKHAAAVVAGGYRAMAERLGDKGQAILDRFNFRVRGDDQAAKAQGVPTGPYELDQPSVEALPQKVTWEAIPSPDIAAEIAAASPAVQAEFTEKALNLLSENGQDALATQLGIESPQAARQSGGFDGRINSNVITSFPASTPVEKVAAYARAVQYLFRQKAVPYFTAKAPGSPGTVEGVAFGFANTLEGAQEEAFFQALREVFGPDVGYTKTDAREAVVINFGKDPKFNEKINLFREKYDERITIKTAYNFGADGDYGPVHDWNADPEGEALRPRADAPGSSSLIAWLDSRRALFDKLLEQYSGESLRAREDAVRAELGGRGRTYWQEANRGTLPAENEARIAGLPASSPGPNPRIRKAAQDYLAKAGIPERRQSHYVEVDPERGKRIADAYEAMRHAPNDPEVQAAYRAFIDETLAQYQVIKELGLVIEMIQPGQPNPYPEGPRQVHEDIRNGHLWVFPTEQGFGSLSTETNHPLLEKTGEKIGDYELVANDVFRIVHDVFGHAKEGFGFGARGEENAWQAHVRMYSPLAAKAMTTETRGQNSWVNFGPYGEANRANQKATIYADQKAGLLPEWVETEGLAPDIEQSFYQTSLPAISGLSPIGFFSQLSREVEKMDFKTIPAKDLAGRIKNLPGIKAEELEWTGFLDWLNGVAEEADVVDYYIVDKTKGIELGYAFTEAEAQAYIDSHWKESPAHKGDEIVVEPRKRGGKVTKEQVTAFLKENGVQVEQVVLAQDFKRDEERQDGELPRPEDLSWDDGEVVEPDSGYISDLASENLESSLRVRAGNTGTPFGYKWIYELEGEAFEKGLKEIENNSYGQETVEKVEELRAEYGPEFTRDDGEIDVEARDARVRADLKRWIDNELLEQAYESEFERYMNDDEHAERKYTERNTGYTLVGSDGSGSWYSFETDKHYTGNIEEAKIQLLADMIEEGVVEGDAVEAIREEDITWRPPRGDRPSYETLKKKANAHFKANKSRLFEQAKNDRDWFGEEAAPTAEQIKKRALMLAGEEVEAAYDDPNNESNTITLSIEHPILEGRITGNNVKGYTFTFSGPTFGATRALEAQTPEAAQEEAMAYLRNERLITPKGQPQAALPSDPGEERWDDPNAPTGRAKWGEHTVRGPKENYREILLTLPRVAGEFKKDVHFRGQKNFVAHVRVSDRIDSNGKKTLFIEELQSDWHQQGRESGYLGDIPKGMSLVQAAEGQFKDPDDGDPIPAGYFVLLNELGEVQAYAKDRDTALEDHTPRGAVPDAPYKQTEAWASLAMKRMLRLAVEQGYDAVAWTPGVVHTDRWGTDSIGWQKLKTEYVVYRRFNGRDSIAGRFATQEKASDFMRGKTLDDEGEYRIEEVPTEAPTFLVGAVEQQGGNADGIDIEGLARMRGQLLERRGERVTTKEELQTVIASTLHRQRGDRSRENLTEQVWKEMQEKETGARFPRKEGMEFFYDNVLPRKVMPALLKKLDKEAKVTTTRILTEDPVDATSPKEDPSDLVAWSVPITDKMREEIGKGFSLFQRDDNSPLGRINFGPDGINIDLLKKANPSTFIHELGHFYLELLKEAALMEDAPADIREDYQKVLTWLGVSDSSQITREHHEKWARGFEKYLAEGNAPSSALREAFEKFKTWLIAVYKELTRLNVTLTPEVRGVMDRLVATREEIAAVQKEVATPLFENPSQYGFTPEKAARYQRLKDEAIRKAEEALLKTHMAELEERQTAEYEAERERIRFEVEAQVNAMPVYKAWAGIRRGETPDGKALPDGATRLSTEGVKEIYGFKTIPGNIRALALTSKDGMHPDVVAELYGFRSGREMVDALSQAVPKDELIDRLTDERMRLERPELIHDPKRLRQEALAAVHNSPRGELLRLELEHLASEDMPLLKEGIRRIAKRVPSNKAVRQQAERIIGATKIRDLRPAGFLFAERRMAKEAGEKLAKGDLDGAFEAKRKELLNHELYRAATAAQASVLKAKKDFKRFFRKDEELAKTREMNLINTARAILARFNIGPRPEKSVASYLDMLREYDKDAHAAMMALYESAVRSTGDLNDVTYDDFEAMKSAVDAMWSLARNMRMVEINGKRMALEEAKSELKARLSELPPMVKPGEPRPGLDRAINDKDRLILGLMGLRARLRRVESWADSMDGGRFRDNPVFRKILVQGVIDALGRYRDAKRAAIEKYLGLVQSIEASLKGTSRTKILAPELGRIRPFEFRNKAHLLGVMLHTGNLSNKSKLVAGMGWGERDAEGNVDFRAFDAFVKRMEDEGVLTKADHDFLQSVWDFFEEYKPEAQRVFKELYGHYFSEITADAIETRFGTYRGGYVPAIPDPEVVSDASVRQDKEALEKVGNSFAFPTTGRGFTKKRVESYAVPLVADLAKLPMLIDKQLRFIHVEPAVKQVARIIMAPDFREALAQVDPTVTEELLVPWLQRAAQQVVEMPIQGKGGRLFAKFMRELRSRSGMQIMFANITNTLQQPTGLAIAAAKVGPLGKRARLRFLRNALWTYITAPKKTTAEIMSMSAAMRNRFDSEAAAMHSTMEELLLDPTKFERAREFAKKHSYFMQSATQNVVDIIVWQATYNEHLEAGFTNDEAVKAADADVRLTQGSLAPEDVASVEANNAFVRAFTQFTSYFNMQANFLGTEFGNVLREVGLKKGYADMAWIYFFGFAAVSVASGFIVEAMSGKIDKDDDDEYLDDLLALLVNSQVRTAVAFVPGAGAAATAAYDALTTGRREDRMSLSPSISAVESSIGALRAGRSLVTGDSINEKKAVRDVLTTLGLISGLPLAPIAKPVGYLMDVESGKADPANALDFARGLVTGRSGQH